MEVELILDALHYRITSLEKELDILEKEIKVIGNYPGTDKSEHDKYVKYGNVKSHLHDLLLYYYNCFKSKSKSQTISIGIFLKYHFEIISSNEFKNYLGQLFQSQSELDDTVFSKFQNYAKDSNGNVTNDFYVLLPMIDFMFPYELEYELLSNKSFFKSFLKIYQSYSPESHQQVIQTIFKNNLFKNMSFENYKSKVRFFDVVQSAECAVRGMKYILAERLISIIAHKKMMGFQFDVFENLRFVERCKYHASIATSSCGVDEDLINKLQNNHNDRERYDFSEEHVRPIENRLSTKYDLELEPEKLPIIRHFVLELKRIPLQPSPTSMMCIISNVDRWLNSSFSDGTNLGADETIPIFTYFICCAKISNLPKLQKYISNFLDQGLMETKFGCILMRLEVIINKVQCSILQTENYIVFPFTEIPKHLSATLKTHDTINLYGFSVYSFPTFSKMYYDFFPAMLKYTGNEEDVAECNRFTIESNQVFIHDSRISSFEVIPAYFGSFLQLSDKFIQKNQMILVNDGKFNKNIGKIARLSSIMKIHKCKLEYPIGHPISLSDEKLHYEEISNTWKYFTKGEEISMVDGIVEIQNALLVLGKLHEGFLINGVLDYSTLKAIMDFVHKSEDDIIEPQDFNTILKWYKKHMSNYDN